MPALTAAVIAITAASSITKFKGERDAANSAESQGTYEKSVYDQNAKYAEQQAADAVDIGQEAEYRHRAGVRGLVGSQRAASAAQGIEIDSGSALDVQLESVGIGELDALTIRNNAAREAWGYKVEAADLRNRGKMAQFAGKTAAASYRNASWSTLLTGASELAYMGANMPSKTKSSTNYDTQSKSVGAQIRGY